MSQSIPTSPSSGHWLTITLFFTLKPQERNRLKMAQSYQRQPWYHLLQLYVIVRSGFNSENDALAMGLASGMKVSTTASQLSKPKSSYKKSQYNSLNILLYAIKKIKKMCDLPSEFQSFRLKQAYFSKYTYSMQDGNAVHSTIPFGMKRGWQRVLTCHNKL